jgi:hypothetical protein
MKQSPWPSGRSLWGSIRWWLQYRGPFLNIVEGVSHEESGVKKPPPISGYEALWTRWDEFTARADHIMATFTEERWNSDVDFWTGPKKERRMKAWEMFLAHFANRLDLEWTVVLEDICTTGLRKELESLIGNDWNFFRKGEAFSDHAPWQSDPRQN